MQGTKSRTVNSIGMFDMLKGAGMLVVVLAHTAENYSLQTGGGLSLTAFFPFIFRESLMAAFYIASGYGFRKRSIGKCVQQQLKTLLKPYCFTAVLTTLLHFIVHYRCFGYLPGSVSATVQVGGGFLLGLPHTAAYFGQQFFSAGPMWYLLALLVGWVLLNTLLNIFPENYQHYAVLGTALLGWGASLVWEVPFCLIQGAVVTPYLYIGYLAKKHRWMDRPLSQRTLGLLLGCCVVILGAALVTRTTDCISLAEWSLGPVSILLDGAVGYLFIRLFLRLSRGGGVLVRFLEAVGRRSLHIFCIHTVELTAIPWYLMAQKFAGREALGLVTHFAVSMGSILLICELLLRRRDWKLQRTAARNAAARRAGPAQRRYAARH